MCDHADLFPPVCTETNFLLRAAPEPANFLPGFFPLPPNPAADFHFTDATTTDQMSWNFTSPTYKRCSATATTTTLSQTFPAVAENGLRPISDPLILFGLKDEIDDQDCCSSLPGYFQRSSSSHSLEQLRAVPSPKQNGFINSSFYSFQENQELSDSQGSSMRRVFSTGDLQRINNLQLGSPLTHENSSVEGLCKVGRYSAEERKERIERYRSKRNQRNFHKKIKYACRKTLADSRPRVRGRFARNEEPGENLQPQWNQICDNDEDDTEIWVNFLEMISMNLIS